MILSPAAGFACRGLVCPRQTGEMGFRVDAATDTAKPCFDVQRTGTVSPFQGTEIYHSNPRRPIFAMSKGSQLLALSHLCFLATLGLVWWALGALSRTSWTLSVVGAELIIFERRPRRRGAPGYIEESASYNHACDPTERQTWASIAVVSPPLGLGSDYSVTLTAAVPVIPIDAETPFSSIPPSGVTYSGSSSLFPVMVPAKPSAYSATAAPSSQATTSDTFLATAPMAPRERLTLPGERRREPDKPSEELVEASLWSFSAAGPEPSGKSGSVTAGVVEATTGVSCGGAARTRS